MTQEERKQLEAASAPAAPSINEEEAARLEMALKMALGALKAQVEQLLVTIILIILNRQSFSTSQELNGSSDNNHLR